MSVYTFRHFSVSAARPPTPPRYKSSGHGHPRTIDSSNRDPVCVLVANGVLVLPTDTGAMCKIGDAILSTLKDSAADAMVDKAAFSKGHCLSDRLQTISSMVYMKSHGDEVRSLGILVLPESLYFEHGMLVAAEVLPWWAITWIRRGALYESVGCCIALRFHSRCSVFMIGLPRYRICVFNASRGGHIRHVLAWRSGPVPQVPVSSSFTTPMTYTVTYQA